MKSITDITPINDRLLVYFKEKEKVSGGGLLLAESAQKKPEVCEIVRVGAGVENKNLAIGTKVMIHNYAGTDIKIGEASYTLVQEKNIIAIIQED